MDGFPKSNTEFVVGEIGEFKGKTYAHLRIVMPSATDEGEWVRTRKGVSIEAERFHEIRAGVEKLMDVASLDRVVAKIAVGKDEVWVGTQAYHNEQYVYVRRFYQSDGEWRPTQKGIAVKTELLEELVDLVRRVDEAARRGEA